MNATLEVEPSAQRPLPSLATEPAIDRRAIHRAMHDSDAWVVELEYVDRKKKRTRRLVSPIRFLDRDRILTLCLCRQEPRQFSLKQCHSVRLIPAAEVMMPAEIVTIDEPASGELSNVKSNQTPSASKSYC